MCAPMIQKLEQRNKLGNPSEQSVFTVVSKADMSGGERGNKQQGNEFNNMLQLERTYRVGESKLKPHNDMVR